MIKSYITSIFANIATSETPVVTDFESAAKLTNGFVQTCRMNGNPYHDQTTLVRHPVGCSTIVSDLVTRMDFVLAGVWDTAIDRGEVGVIRVSDQEYVMIIIMPASRREIISADGKYYRVQIAATSKEAYDKVLSALTAWV